MCTFTDHFYLNSTSEIRLNLMVEIMLKYVLNLKIVFSWIQ